MEAFANGKGAQPYSAFREYVSGVETAAGARYRAIFERQDADTLKTDVDRCMGLRDIQIDLVQQMRDQLAGR